MIPIAESDVSLTVTIRGFDATMEFLEMRAQTASKSTSQSDILSKKSENENESSENQRTYLSENKVYVIHTIDPQATGYPAALFSEFESAKDWVSHRRDPENWYISTYLVNHAMPTGS